MTPVLVWFKRDLRIDDHAPLIAAKQEGPVLPLYVVEPGYWANAYTSGRQWQFLKESVVVLDQELSALGQSLWTAVGDIETVLTRLHQRFHFTQMHSHQETGPLWTFERDLRVRAWCQQHDVRWIEHRQHGVMRGLKSRTQWATQWDAFMSETPYSGPDALIGVGAPPKSAADVLAQVAIADEFVIQAQPGGMYDAERTLQSFLESRGETYRGGMSSPLTAPMVCSRLSTHLSLGAVSLRRVWQESQSVRAQYKDKDGRGRFVASLKSFGSRLHWHCHFMQKLETEPRIEWEDMHRGFAGLRPVLPESPERLERLISGSLGWPFVDACLRCLAQTGWINFRMRAMLVSVASYHLWLDWRETAPVFARWFTDFEAGIHFSQMQMQSGTTGINANRMYAPLKQSQDQDPNGQFIRQWVPELVNVPDEWIHMPWRMPVRQQERVGCLIGRDYPMPIGDALQLAREARARLKDWIQTHDLQPEAARVLQTHGSRLRQSRPRYVKKTSLEQMDLDL
jgi:deoxyribodipyrimidine photo-lyase